MISSEEGIRIVREAFEHAELLVRKHDCCCHPYLAATLFISGITSMVLAMASVTVEGDWSEIFREFSDKKHKLLGEFR